MGLLMCLILISCSKKEQGNLGISNSTYSEQDANNIQIHVADDIILPKIEISQENIFVGFPENPDYFIENNIAVTIEKTNEQPSQFPVYFGLEPVYVTGENFEIVYATDTGYEIRLIILKGESMFSYWNQYFDATWDEVKKSWGSPEAGSRSYFDSTGWYYVDFIKINETTGKIREIRLGLSL
jgi:hypothetical protein